jgi:SPASM domain peptide maturase of grasp-with-spasm system
MEQSPTYFKIFAHNIPVSGKERSAIYDLQKGEITLIPNILYKIIQDLNQQSLNDVRLKYAPNNPELFDNYINFLLKKDLGFKTKSPESFPDLILEYDIPTEIYTAIIESDFKKYNVKSLLETLNELLCQNLEMRLNINDLTEEEVLSFVRLLDEKTFRSVVLILDYRQELWYEDWAITLYEACSKINKIIVVNCPINFESKEYSQQISYSTKTLSELGEYRKRYIVNQNYFTEALQFNPFYNRKICIDNNGNIKNDLRQQESFGSIADRENVAHQLNEILNNESFRERWHASPDTIEELKDSELRYCQFIPFLLEKNKEKCWSICDITYLEPAI